MRTLPEVGTVWEDKRNAGLFPRVLEVQRVDPMKTHSGFHLIQSRVLSENGQDLTACHRWSTHCLAASEAWSDHYRVTE